MGIEEDLDKGEKIDIHVWLYPAELAVVDSICAKYDCSRSSVFGAWSREYTGRSLKGKVKPGRRPGAGRPPTKKR